MLKTTVYHLTMSPILEDMGFGWTFQVTTRYSITISLISECSDPTGDTLQYE